MNLATNFKPLWCENLKEGYCLLSTGPQGAMFLHAHFASGSSDLEQILFPHHQASEHGGPGRRWNTEDQEGRRWR